MKTTTNTITRAALTYARDLTPQQARALAVQAAKTAVRARDRMTPTPMTRALMLAAVVDQHSAGREDAAALLLTYEAEAAAAARKASTARADMLKITSTDEQRAANAAKYDRESGKRDNARANAAAVRDALCRLAGNFADLSAAALVQYYTTLREPVQPSADLLAQYGYSREDWPQDVPAAERDEISSRAAYKSMIAAAGAAMNALASLNGLDGWHTDTAPLLDAYVKQHGSAAAAQAATLDYWRTRCRLHTSPAAYAALDAGRAALAILDDWTADSVTDADMIAAALDRWTSAHGGTGKDYRRETAAGYITVEHLPATAKRPTGWYKVTHRRTIRAAQSLDEMQAAAGSAAEIADPDGRAADEDAARADRAAYLAALMDAANLNSRARAWIADYCSDAAQAAADAAGAEYAAHRRKWDANRRAAYRNAQHAAAEAYADAQAGYSPAAAQKAHKRLFDRIKAAQGRAILTDTGKSRHEERSERAYIRAAFANRRPVSYNPDSAHRIPVMPELGRPAAAHPAWQTAAEKIGIDPASLASAHGQPANIEPTAADSRRAAWVWEMRRRMDEHKTPSAYAALDAAVAARVFLAEMTAEDIQQAADTAAAEQAATAANAAERRAAVQAVRAAYPSFDEWRSMTRAERDAWIATH